MSKKYESRLIHSYKSYKISDICRLYKEQKIHPQTVRKWIKLKELEAFEFQGEFYIYGAILKEYFEQKVKTSKIKLAFHQFKCWKCKIKDSPLNNIITKIITVNGGYLMTFGICKACGHEMQRPFKSTEEIKIRETFTIQLEQQTTLYNTSTTTKKTHFEIEQKEIASEHYQNIENCTQRNAINIHCQQKRSTDELFVSSPIKNSSNDIYKCTNTHIKEQKLKPCSSTPTKTTHFEIEQKMPANESNSNQLSFNFL